MKELEDILLLAIRPLMKVTNAFHERSMSDVSVKPDSQMLVDSLGLVSQVIYKVFILEVECQCCWDAEHWMLLKR